MDDKGEDSSALGPGQMAPKPTMGKYTVIWSLWDMGAATSGVRVGDKMVASGVDHVFQYKTLTAYENTQLFADPEIIEPTNDSENDNSHLHYVLLFGWMMQI